MAFASIAAYPFLPRSYSATSTILFHPVEPEPDGQHSRSQQEEIDDNLISTQIDLMRTRPLLSQVAEENHLLSDPEFNTTLHHGWRQRLDAWRRRLAQWWPEQAPPHRNPMAVVAANLAKHLTVSRDLKSYLIQVTFRSADQNKAPKLANTLADQYLRDQVARKRYRQQQLLAALDDFVAEAKKRYQLAESRQHEFLVQSGLIHRGRKEAIQRQLDILSGAVANAHKDSIDRDSRAQELIALSKSGALDSASDVLASQLLQHLQEHLAVVKSGSGAVAYGSSVNNVAGNLRSEIARDRQEIVNAAQTDALMTHMNEIQLRAEIDRLDQQLVTLNEAERHADDLARETDAASRMLGTALTRRADELSHSMLLRPDAEVVAQAVAPISPSFPAPLPYLAGTAALCLMILILMLAPVMPATKLANDSDCLGMRVPDAD